MWTIVSDFASQSINCAMPSWTSDFPGGQADCLSPIYAQIGVKILAAALLTLMFQSVKSRMNAGELTE
jgi:hypothetical protein